MSAKNIFAVLCLSLALTACLWTPTEASEVPFPFFPFPSLSVPFGDVSLMSVVFAGLHRLRPEDG